jgi:hypothetical protein
MRHFLRFIRILTVLGLFTGLAGAQPAPFTCIAYATSNPALRGESYTEQTGDIVIPCTGGTAIAPGSLLPSVNFTIFYNTTVTSRLTPPTGNFNFSEALLLIDEPGSGQPGFGESLPQVLCTTPLTGCPAFVGAVPGPTFGQAVSSGTTPAPNVYQGVVAGNSVTFFGVPVLTPTATGQRVFRITNVLVDATPLTGNSPLQANPVQATIAISGAAQFPIANPSPIVGYVSAGLTATASAATQLPQCSSQTRTSVNLLQFSENFDTSFKTRVFAQTNTSYAGQINNPVQNIPGDIYNSESGFVFPIGTQSAGLADFGTRLKATFNNIPAGVRIYVSTSNVLNEVTPVTAPAVVGGFGGNSFSGLNQPYVGYAQLINGEATSDDNSVPAVPPTNTGPGTGGTVPVIELPVLSGHATAVWEVVNTNPNIPEDFKFAVYATYVANPGQNTPTPGTATVNLSYAPNTNSGMAADASVPLPRFTPDPNPASAVFTMNSCGSASITVDTAPSGRAIAVDGTSYTAPQTFNWLVGTNHTLNASTPQGGPPGTRYVFANWSQGGAMAQTITVPSSASSYIANFDTEYQLTSNVNPAAGGSITAGGWFGAGTVQSIGASANAGYQFAGFSGDLTGLTSPQNLTMNAPRNVVANFSALAPILNGSISSRSGAAATRQWMLTLTNSGLGAATGARITGLALTQTGGVACSASPVIVDPVPPPSPSNPLLVGNVAASSSGSAGVTLNFGGCAPSARFKVVIGFAADGGYSGSTTLNNQFY